MKILLANPRGFCAGVDRAIDIVQRALDLFGKPIYVRHEVVHNRFVVNNLKEKGAIFVDELDEVPAGATVIFSAHGVSKAVKKEARERELNVFDATCPLVTKVHMEVQRYRKNDTEVVMIGHQGHPEVDGTMGQGNTGNGQDTKMHLVENVEQVQKLSVTDERNIAYVTQTTLSVDDTQQIISALRAKFPQIQGPRKEDICYATQNRQDAVRELAKKVDLLLVVGSVNSSNSNRLKELAEQKGVTSYLVDEPCQIKKNWFDNVAVVGVTAGASAPDDLVKMVIKQLESFGGKTVTEITGPAENVTFSLPILLRS